MMFWRLALGATCLSKKSLVKCQESRFKIHNTKSIMPLRAPLLEDPFSPFQFAKVKLEAVEGALKALEKLRIDLSAVDSAECCIADSSHQAVHDRAKQSVQVACDAVYDLSMSLAEILVTAPSSKTRTIGFESFAEVPPSVVTVTAFRDRTSGDPGALVEFETADVQGIGIVLRMEDETILVRSLSSERNFTLSQSVPEIEILPHQVKECFKRHQKHCFLGTPAKPLRGPFHWLQLLIPQD